MRYPTHSPFRFHVWGSSTNRAFSMAVIAAADALCAAQNCFSRACLRSLIRPAMLVDRPDKATLAERFAAAFDAVAPDISVCHLHPPMLPRDGPTVNVSARRHAACVEGCTRAAGRPC